MLLNRLLNRKGLKLQQFLKQIFAFFIHDKLRAVGGDHYFKTEIIIQKSHERGAYELIHRSIKEFATKKRKVCLKAKMIMKEQPLKIFWFK